MPFFPAICALKLVASISMAAAIPRILDDMPGRLMGEVIGVKAVDVAEQFFVGKAD